MTTNFCVIMVLVVVFKVYCATSTLININNKLDINLKFNLKSCKRGKNSTTKKSADKLGEEDCSLYHRPRVMGLIES